MTPAPPDPRSTPERAGPKTGALTTVPTARRREASMEVRPGVFLSNVNTDRWQPDPDVPGSEMHELVHEGPLWAGLTRITDALEPTPWAPDQRETAIVLEGSVRIEFSDG